MKTLYLGKVVGLSDSQLFPVFESNIGGVDHRENLLHFFSHFVVIL